ncbi:MAG TPA: class I tRNA ligase family protein, partial [Polyangiales bacterium]|nr:class I tRNA ligase family protein [Polyangiales bacterium]
DDAGNTYVARSEAEVRSKYGLPAELPLRQDDDVLDTWFSSSLWTFSTLGWPDDKSLLPIFHPTDVLVTGFDIIFFWVARMIMMTMHFMKNEDGTPQVPFKTVYVTGLVRDAEGQKMSKSKGNILDPLDIIDGIDLDALVQKRTSDMMQPQLAAKVEKHTRKDFPQGIAMHGTDALRFTLLSLASTGRDIKFDMGRLEGYRNFCNKIWNATRYVLMNCEGQDVGREGELKLSLADRWIVSRLSRTEARVAKALAEFRFDLASQAIYEFIWNEYCDWYLELSKPVLNDAGVSDAEKRGTRHTLLAVLERTLRLTHPMMPFLTEELWHQVAPMIGVQGKTIMLQPYPEADTGKIDEAAEADIAWLQGVIVAVRTIRSEMNIAPSRALPVLLQKGNATDRARSETYAGFLNSLAKLESLTWLAPDAEPPMTAIQLVGEMQVLVPIAGFIDKDAELARLQKEIGKVKQDMQKVESKLNNADFIARAPAEVVQKDKARVAELSSALSDLNAQLVRMQKV